MSIRQGKKLIASSTTNGFNLFDCKWADHILNNISWLRADTFSWQSGDVYVAAYEHLAEDVEVVSYIVSLNSTYYRTPSDDVVINGTQYYAWTTEFGGVLLTTSATPQTSDSVYNRDGTVNIAGIQDFVIYIKGAQTETIGNITITYALADDGHKICLPDQESNISALYENTGIAWYYILDTTNRQFKLPRTKWGFTGIRSGVGGYVAPGLPNITGSFSTASDKNLGTGAFSWTTNKYATNGGGQGGQWGINFSAKKSNSIYGNSNTVQPPATQMYLYFYVGNFTQTALENTAGLNAEMFNDLNAHKVIEFQAPTASNGYTWYRKYADGWVEQGGRCTVPATNSLTSSSVTVTLPVPIATPEQATLAYNGMDSTKYYANCEDMASVTTTTVSIGRYNNGSYVAVARYYNWSLSGMAA